MQLILLHLVSIMKKRLELGGSMVKDKNLLFTLMAIIVFNILFIIILAYYYDIITINVFVKPPTKEYWYWWLDADQVFLNQSLIISTTSLLKLVFSLIFLLEFFYIMLEKKYKDLISKKNIVISLIVGAIVYSIIFLFIRYKAEHYRLFMTLISTEIFSIILLNLILYVNKKLN